MEPQPGIVDFALFQQLDVRVGRIISAEPAEGCRVPAYKLLIDFGELIGTRRSIAQATNYPRESLTGRQILAVVNFKPRQIGKTFPKFWSWECPRRRRARRWLCLTWKHLLGEDSFS